MSSANVKRSNEKELLVFAYNQYSVYIPVQLV